MLGFRKTIKLLTYLAIAYPAFGEELVRLDKIKVEAFDENTPTVSLFITEACSVCDRQVSVLNQCLEGKEVVAFLEGPQEEKLRRTVARKKIPFKTYLLNQSLKKRLGFANVSPALRIKTSKGFIVLSGLQSCETIKSQL